MVGTKRSNLNFPAPLGQILGPISGHRAANRLLSVSSERTDLLLSESRERSAERSFLYLAQAGVSGFLIRHLHGPERRF